MPTKACQDLVSQNDWCWWFHHFTLSVECQSLPWECTGINVLNFWTLQNKPSVQTQKVWPRIHSRMERSKISWSETPPALVSCGLLNQHDEYILSWDASFLKDLWVIWCHLMPFDVSMCHGCVRQKTQENPHILRRPRIVQDLSLSPHENNWKTFVGSGNWKQKKQKT